MKLRFNKLVTKDNAPIKVSFDNGITFGDEIQVDDALENGITLDSNQDTRKIVIKTTSKGGKISNFKESIEYLTYIEVEENDTIGVKAENITNLWDEISSTLNLSTDGYKGKADEAIKAETATTAAFALATDKATNDSDGNKISDTYIKVETKGKENGIATLDANGHVPVDQMPIEALIYKGQWDASTTTYPTQETYTIGDFYIVSTEGTVGSIKFYVGDWIIWDGKSWSRSANSNAVASVNGKVGAVTLSASDVGALASTVTHLSGDVPTTRTVNSKTLSSNITLSASDVGALASTVTHLSGDVPITRTVNGKTLSSNITLSASDVGALPSSTTHLSGDVPTTRTINSKTLSSNITLTASDIGIHLYRHDVRMGFKLSEANNSSVMYMQFYNNVANELTVDSLYSTIRSSYCNYVMSAYGYMNISGSNTEIVEVWATNNIFYITGIRKTITSISTDIVVEKGIEKSEVNSIADTVFTII